MAGRSENELEHKPSETLLRNRKRMGSAKAKTQDIRASGNGQEPRPAPDRPQRDKPIKSMMTAAKGLTGRSSDYDQVMGKVIDMRTKKVRLKDEIDYHREGKKGRSDTLPSNLHIPIARPQRLATEDGRTSFHFSHDSISKTRNAVVSDSGRVNRPGAAKAHNKYIERDSAVAIDGEGEEIAAANDDELAPRGRMDLDQGSAIGDIADQDIANGVESAATKEPYFDRPISRSFLRTYRTVLGALLSDSDPDPRGSPPDEVDGLRDMPGRDLVPDTVSSQMLLRADQVHVMGRDGAGDQGLRREGDGDPEGAGGRWGLKPVPARLSRVEQKSDTSKAIAALGKGLEERGQNTPDGQGKYIERQEALAIQPDGTRVLFTNIDESAEKRAEFWRLVEEHEREAEPDKMTFTVADNETFWKAVAAHADCPDKLALAIAVSDPSKRVTVESDDNVQMRKFLSSIEGWKDAGAKQPGEKPDAYKARRADDTCKFHDGRGGRVQYRIIGELPHELGIKGRAAILREFSQEFEKRKLPFVSVMHAPDHTNNDKNWHFHLVYYDRPCSRLTAEAISNAPVDPNAKNMVVEPVGQEAVGSWDFTAIEKFKTSSREIRERRPFAQEKVKEVSRHQDWVEKLRGRLSAITNDELEKAGIARRIDPRRHTEMGIHNNPQEHLGTKLANLEAMGIATPLGVSNEERQWTSMQKKLDADLERRKSVIDQTARKWLQKAGRASHIDDETKAGVRANVAQWHQHKTESEEHIAIAENVTQHIERTTSRAKKVQQTCKKQLDAIDAGKVTKTEARRADNLRHKSEEAVEWLNMTMEILKDEVKLAQDCRRTADLEGLAADQLELQIERALAPASVAQIAAEDRRRRDEEEERLRKAGEQREATQKDADRRNAMVKEDMDRWITKMLSTGRRLVRQDKVIVPAYQDAEDKAVVASLNYSAMQGRLVGMKRKQDDLIARVVKELQDRPETVIEQRRGRSVSYELVTNDNELAKAFRTYGREPEVETARNEAVAYNREAAARRSEERRIAAEQREADRLAAQRPSPDRPVERPAPVERDPVPAERPVAPVVPSRPATPDLDAPREPVASTAAEERRARVAERQALSDRIFRAVNEDSRRIVVRDKVAMLNQDHLDAIGVTAQDVSDPMLQRRLVGLAAVQEREIKRVTGFARKNPSRLIERDGHIVFSAKAPREMIEMVSKWKDDEMLGITLRAIRDDSRGVGRVDPIMPVQAEAPARPVAPAPEPTRPAAPVEQTAPRPEPTRPSTPEPARPRFAEIEDDHEMREAARLDAEARERRRQVAQESEESRRLTRAERTGEDDFSRVVRTASEKAATIGAHPLIDQWMDAVKEGLPVEERRKLAMRIEYERDARERLKDIDRQVAKRIREDIGHAKDEQQPSLGLDLGQTPKR